MSEATAKFRCWANQEANFDSQLTDKELEILDQRFKNYYTFFLFVDWIQTYHGIMLERLGVYGVKLLYSKPVKLDIDLWDLGRMTMRTIDYVKSG
jgi:hypothetical protein